METEIYGFLGCILGGVLLNKLYHWIKEGREDRLFWKQVEANKERIDKEFKDAIYKALEAAVLKAIHDQYSETFNNIIEGKEKQDGTTN